MSDLTFAPGDRVITTDGSYFLRTREFNVQVAEDEWEPDWEDYEVQAKPGNKGTVVRSNSYETTVELDGGKEHRMQTKGLERLTALGLIVDALNHDALGSAAV